MIVVGVDPGGRYTGLVVREHERLLHAEVITRHADHDIADHDTILHWIELVTDRIGAALQPGFVLAVEGVRKPNPHVRRGDGNSLTNPDGIIATAAVLGGILILWPAAVIAAPGGNGLGHLSGYPEGIRSGTRLGGPTAHARSAWDVAGQAAFLSRVAAAASKNGGHQ